VIADRLGHSSVVLAADTYLSVAVELGLKAAADAARLVLNAGKRPPGGGGERERHPAAERPGCWPRSSPDHQTPKETRPDRRVAPPCPNDPRTRTTLTRRDSRAFSMPRGKIESSGTPRLVPRRTHQP